MSEARSELLKHANAVVIHRPKPWERVVYSAARATVDAVNRLYWDTQVTYEAGLPKTPFILAPTHRSYIDTILVGSVVPHYMHFMAKLELWKKPLLASVLEVLGAFPVDRDGADRSALSSALEVLSLGDGLVVFPEGERREGPEIRDLHEGVAYLSLRAKVPVVPVGFYGSDAAMAKGTKVPRRARVRAVVGPPMYPEIYRGEGGATKKTVPRRAIVEMTNALQGELQRLYDRGRLL